MVESSEILQIVMEQYQSTKHMPKLGKISPKEQEYERQARITPKSGKISPNKHEEVNPRPSTPSLSEIPQKESQQVTDLIAIKDGVTAKLNGGNAQQGSPQVDTAEHYLDDNFSDVMRSSAQRSNVSSLFNTIAFNTTHNEHKVTLD